MTERHVHTIELFGQASPGFARPNKHVDRDSAGSDTPKDLRRKGVINENPYTAQLDWRIDRQISFKEGANIRYCSSASGGAVPVFDAVSAPTFTDVVPKLAERWRASEFNLGVFLVEGRESAEMIAGRMLSIIKSANAIRKGNLGDALRHLAKVPKANRRKAQKYLEGSVSSFSSAWLELQLGWSPLINDISAAAEALKVRPTVGRVKARSANRGTCHPQLPSVPQSRIQLFNNDQRLQYIVVVSHTPSLMERLGLKDALSIAWEAVPLSFVIDYFAPIGDYLATLHAVNVMPVTKVISTSSSKRIANCHVLPGDTIAGYPVISGGVTTKISIGMSRTIQSSLPVAWALNAQIPRIAEYEDATLKRMGNLAALTQQSLRRLYR